MSPSADPDSAVQIVRSEIVSEVVSTEIALMEYASASRTFAALIVARSNAPGTAVAMASVFLEDSVVARKAGKAHHVRD